MKKFIYTLALVFSFAAIALNADEDATSYAFYYSNTAQVGIAPSHIVEITNLGTKTKSKYKLSSDKGIKVPSTGNYLISYRVLANTQVSLALFKDGVLIPDTAFSNTTASPVLGSVIIPLDKKDVVTIRNIETAKTFNTVASVSSTTPTLPVNITIQYLGN